MKIVLFGAGKNGMEALNEIGEDRIAFFLDNNKRGMINDIPIFTLEEGIKNIDHNTLIIIATAKYVHEMIEQLKKYNLKNFFVYKPGICSHRNYKNRLSSNEWGDIYNDRMVNAICSRILEKNNSVQTTEMLRLTKEGEKVLEIGCGSGETSLVLSQNRRVAYAIDYSDASINLLKKLVEKTGFQVESYCIDAVKTLPFSEREFDVVFQAGLLEHFDQQDRIDMLLNWKKVCKKMISMIPNAHCLAYRIGKDLDEKNGTWKYGLEMPQASLREEFQKAGFTDIEEYTIGELHALDFLPKPPCPHTWHHHK